MAIASDGYRKDMLAIAFDHLCENKKATRGFLANNAKSRKFWMDSYFSYLTLTCLFGVDCDGTFWIW